jgi:hypothetical protein
LALPGRYQSLRIRRIKIIHHLQTTHSKSKVLLLAALHLDVELGEGQVEERRAGGVGREPVDDDTDGGEAAGEVQVRNVLNFVSGRSIRRSKGKDGERRE